jgi:hypothetical protein
MEDAFDLGFAIVIAVLATATRTKPWRNGLSNGMCDMIPDCIVLMNEGYEVSAMVLVLRVIAWK